MVQSFLFAIQFALVSVFLCYRRSLLLLPGHINCRRREQTASPPSARPVQCQLVVCAIAADSWVARASHVYLDVVSMS